MFWKFTLLTSHIETLLEKEDVTLQELMDEDDVLQECKAQNRKLLDMLVRPDIMEELVNFITQEPVEDTDEKVRYKYPNTACELLTSDVSVINDKLAGEEALLNKIYSFLESEGPLNPLLASFFSKVMGLLIARKSESMVEFLQGKDDFVGALLSHLGTSAIMDLLLRLITCIECPEVRLNVITWLNEQKLVQRLIGLLDSTVQEEKHCNASQAICDMIKLSRERNVQMQDEAEPDPLLETLESPDTISDMLTHMFDHKMNESVLVNGLAILQTLLEFKRPVALFASFEGNQETMTQLDEERLQQGIHNTLQALIPRLKDIHNLLVEPPKQYYNTMPTTLGSLDPPLGNTRLQVSRLIATVVATNTSSVDLELVNLGTIKVLLNLFYDYSWNNFLHTQVVHLITSILNNAAVTIDGEEKHPLLQEVVCECRLLEKLLDSWEDNEQIQARPGGHRRGFMGHLTKMANEFVQVTERGNNVERIKELLKEVPDDVQEKWDSFVSGTLADCNKKNTVDLELPCGPDLLARVGAHPLPSSSEDDDADFSNIPFPQDTAMQQLQQMTSNFIDQFGFNEEEFAEQNEHVDSQFNDKISSIDFSISTNEEPPNAAMFEQVCNQRIQRFDDAERDSDEDVWEEKEITYSPGMDSEKQSVPQRRARAGASSDEDSSDEEDLDSPAVIRSQPPSASSTEKMDVDSTQDWPANFHDEPMEPAPVAMDTVPSAWENPAPSIPQETGWASFGDAKSEGAAGKDEEWADFTSFSSMEATTSNSDQPRSSSPDRMDIAESTSSRTAAYVVPNDAESKEVASSSDSTSSNPSSSSDAKEAVAPKSPATTDVMAVEPDSTSSDPLPDNGTAQSCDNHSSSQDNTNSDDVTNLTEFNAELPPDHDEEDDDLSDNFNFLAARGLMKTVKPNKVETEVHGNGPTEPDSSIDTSPKKLETKESCSSPADSATSPPVTLNGPV
ncbi:serine/threonine-protein phosphatase 6 regulatory subunit 3-like isoform X2 [Lineus longissimus]|uniref:serine/threonine-protein phosphatase 6 regulatory subunit 3-like isoform X2 n=1 Tax=Lineus longissimus TaxID=88925 RepID=UPI00315D9EBE